MRKNVHWHQKKIEEVIGELGVTLQGLSTEDARNRLLK
jgi:hypothetical protein